MDDHQPASGEAFDDLAALARTIRPDDAELLPVPADLWSKIEAEVRNDPPAVAPPVERDAAPVVPIGTSRRRRHFGVVLGGLAAAAALTVAVWLVARPGDDTREVARVDLRNDGLAAFPIEPSGVARLVDDAGRFYLDIELRSVPSSNNGYVELWMIDTAVQGMVSLGPYHGDDRYAVPPGVDPGAYPVVDVSLEPVDGVPTHSGVSVVRGVLPDASA